MMDSLLINYKYLQISNIVSMDKIGQRVLRVERIRKDAYPSAEHLPPSLRFRSYEMRLNTSPIHLIVK